jgi:TolB protein
VIEEFPTWSLDGRFLAFISFRDGHRDIFLMDDATGDVDKVTHGDGSYWIGNWSADNAALIYYGYRTGGSVQGELFSFDLQGRTIRQLTTGHGWKLQPRITPDGLLIAYQRNWKLHFLSSDGTIDVQVMSVPDSVSDQMQWSSQGDFLVFQAFANGRWDIYRVNRSGSGVVNLTKDSFEAYTPVLSPDDSEIAYVANTGTVSKVYLMNNNGDNKRALTNRNQREFSPSWGNF